MSAVPSAPAAVPLTAGLGALLLCAALGSAAVLGFAPFYFWLIPVLSLAALAWLVDQTSGPRRAAVLALAFGLGFFVTGVSWVDGELWHATWESDESEIRRVDPASGEVLHQVVMPAGTNISGMESDGKDLFYCGAGGKGMVRAVRRPRGGSPDILGHALPPAEPGRR